MDCPQRIAGFNESCPTRPCWTNRTVGDRIVVDDHAGFDGRQQLRKLDYLARRAVGPVPFAGYKSTIVE
jgi:hypothetical protein